MPNQTYYQQHRERRSENNNRPTTNETRRSWQPELVGDTGRTRSWRRSPEPPETKKPCGGCRRASGIKNSFSRCVPMGIIVDQERKKEEKNGEVKSNNGQIGAWFEHAHELTKWACSSLFARDDAYPQWFNGWKCVHKDLTEAVVRDHFHGNHTIGVYTLGRDNTCRWIGWDIDHHDGDPGDPAANWRYAQLLVWQLERMGACPLLEDSNGSGGGFHVWLRFADCIPGSVAYSVASWLVQGCDDAIHAEAFPKQAQLNEHGVGNQMRLPGKHHKRNHWSRFYVGGRWIEGEEAIRHLLAWEPTDITVFPQRAREFVPPPPAKKPRTPTANGNGQAWDEETDGHWCNQFDGDLRTLDITKLCADRLGNVVGYDKHAITCPWNDTHTTGDGGTCVWEAVEGEKFPGFSCRHAHCENIRTLQDLLEFYGKAAVDACCSREFGDTRNKINDEVNGAIAGGTADLSAGNSESDPTAITGSSKNVQNDHPNPTTPTTPDADTDADQADDGRIREADWHSRKTKEKSRRRRAKRPARCRRLRTAATSATDPILSRPRSSWVASTWAARCRSAATRRGSSRGR